MQTLQEDRSDITRQIIIRNVFIRVSRGRGVVYSLYLLSIPIYYYYYYIVVRRRSAWVVAAVAVVGVRCTFGQGQLTFLSSGI